MSTTTGSTSKGLVWHELALPVVKSSGLHFACEAALGGLHLFISRLHPVNADLRAFAAVLHVSAQLRRVLEDGETGGLARLRLVTQPELAAVIEKVRAAIDPLSLSSLREIQRWIDQHAHHAAPPVAVDELSMSEFMAADRLFS